MGLRVSPTLFAERARKRVGHHAPVGVSSLLRCCHRHDQFPLAWTVEFDQDDPLPGT